MKFPCGQFFSRLAPMFTLAGVLVFVSAAVGASATINSPDGKLSAVVSVSEGRLSYRVTLDGQPVLTESPLGLVTEGRDLSRDLKLEEETSAVVRAKYELPHGKVRQVDVTAHERVFRLSHPSGASLSVVFRVSDRDVAFCYRLADSAQGRVAILREETGFGLPEGATAFATWQAKPGDGYKASKPSYEEPYQMDVPVGTPSPTGLGFTFPALFRLPTNAWVLVSETGVTGNYVGSRLADPDAAQVYRIAFPEAGENGGAGEALVRAGLPLQTPWRTLTVGKTLAPIVESTVATDWVEPLYQASQVYKPGRASWSWLLWQDASMNLADQETFVDLAAKMGFEYILVDALWDEAIGREKIAEFVARARARGVGVILWYNSNGYWNDAPQTPRHRMDSPAVRHHEMAWLRRIGVVGLKIDFFGGDKQETMRLYEAMLADANAYGLMLNFHGATLPRGWERMFPNYMTSEAITASENLVFSQAFADKEAFNSTVFPFIRNPVGPMDYGPVLLNRVYSRDQKGGSQRRTTVAFQLATAVLFQSPLQHFGLTPNNLVEQPREVIQFLREVPAHWDETRYVGGYPGKWVALARRSGERWYVAVTHSEASPKTVVLELPFLAGRTLQILGDGPALGAQASTVTLPSDGRLELTLAPGGGAVLH